MHMTSQVGIQPDKFDSYATPPDTWRLVEHLLPKGSVVWEAAYLEGSPGPRGLHNMGLDVIYDEIDFMTQVPERPFDYIVTNPPFSDKLGWIRRAIELGKPFIFLMPSSLMVARHWVTQYADDPKMQVMLPRRRLSYLRFENGVMMPPSTWTKSPFDTAFYCYGFNLPDKITYCADIDVQKQYAFKRTTTRLEHAKKQCKHD
jgi:hypothetical protein